MSDRSDMPSKAVIAEYWSDRLIEMNIEELPVDDMSCFVCGAGPKLQRSHILAMCDGGKNSVENLHLLCRQCHDESEILSGDIYWRWYRGKRKVAYISPGIRDFMKLKAVFPDLDEITEGCKDMSLEERNLYIKELLRQRIDNS